EVQKKIFKTTNSKKIQKMYYPYSDELQKKLALLIKNIEAVDEEDLKGIEYKKIETEANNDLFISYRLDFHTRDELNEFKKKYNSLIL
ncbi:uncharacterized protein METZ01_LOCUS471846, partial [marine metagenome]